jgi:hypothetical protein
MPWGTEVIDDGGIKVWTDSPDIAAVEASNLRFNKYAGSHRRKLATKAWSLSVFAQGD